MAGTKAGSKKAVAKILAKDPDFFKKIGRKGGSVSTPTGGFGYSHERAAAAGRRGGKVSRRGKAGSHKIRVKQIESTDEVLEIHTDWEERHTDWQEDMSGHTVDVISEGDMASDDGGKYE